MGHLTLLVRRVAHVYILLFAGSAARQLLGPAASPTPQLTQERALLSFSTGFDNFAAVRDANRFSGWDQDGPPACELTALNQSVTSNAAECDPENPVYRSGDRNLWTGVTCNPSGQVICVNLPSIKLSGPVSVLSQLEALPALAFLNLNGNQLQGTLPPFLGTQLSGLEILRLSSTGLNSTLPPKWGSGESWQKLQTLELQSNDLYGTLPVEWGEPEAWADLLELNVSENRLQGSIPGNWGGNGSAWPSLQAAWLEPGNSDLCGVVPEGFPALKATGDYITGPTYDLVENFNQSCSSSIDPYITPDPFGDGLSGGEIVGIMAGQVVAGALFLFGSAVIHRRYRWRLERDWVLFDWEVLAAPGGSSPPRTNRISIGSALFVGWGLKGGSFKRRRRSADTGAQKDISPMFAEETHAANRAANGEQADAGQQAPASLSGFPALLGEDSFYKPEELVLQKKPDGSLHQLGHGSFGKVYKGVLQDVHDVAIKVFEGYVGQREQELLLKEISILRSCRNKNIVQFFGVCIQQSDIWMVMELMESNLFRHLARGHHCQWYFRGRKIALDIARGMHYLHGRNIIHMDLKSPNILLSSNGTAKIADVGLARVMGNESIATQVGAGTVHWMAPEVLIDGRCTEKADIFSFGIILWEICTGESPSRGRMTTVSVPEDCPQGVADLMERCIDEDEAKRPTAGEIIHEINSFPVTTKPVPQPPWYARGV